MNMTLLESQKKLNEFQFIHCGLKHEMVLLDESSNVPIKTDIEKRSYKRKDLCKNSIRNKRLGCAHSLASKSFNNIINELDVKDPTIEKLRVQVNDTILNINILDMRKGNLELEVAKKLDPENESEFTSIQIEEELNAAIKQHSNYVDHLANLKMQIVQRIDELISSGAVSNQL